MLLHQPGQKITRPHIVMLLGASGEVIPQKPDNRFMISQKIGDHLGGFRISRLLFEPGLAHKLGERPVIAQLYKCRWQVELFFKWIKQHMRIKAFYGTTENTVKTQIWIAICVYVLVAIIKKRLKLDRSLYTILQILSVSLFEKTPILQVLSSTDYEDETVDTDNQLNLFV